MHVENGWCSSAICESHSFSKDDYEEWRFRLGANKWMSDKGNDEFAYDLTYVIQNATNLILLAYPMRLLNCMP